MDRVQERTQKSPPNDGTIRAVILNVISRGVDVDELTLGEIIYVEKLAHERDQINWACSAQSKELLPKTKKKSQQAKAEWNGRIRGHFERVKAQEEKPTT